MIITLALYLCIQAHNAACEEQKLGLINTADIQERAQMLLDDPEFIAANQYDKEVWAKPTDSWERIVLGYEPNEATINKLVSYYLSMQQEDCA